MRRWTATPLCLGVVSRFVPMAVRIWVRAPILAPTGGEPGDAKGNHP
jgi:hypothetical protein